MRTTIELSERQRALLITLAAKKGMRGFSKIIEDALELYFQELAMREKSSLLKLQGAWSREEAREVREHVNELRRNWKG